MKKILLSISLTLIAVASSGQTHWFIDFESPLYLNHIARDTNSNPNCSWQVGQPNKTVFTSAQSVPNAIMTDTINPVPPNDTSTFYLYHVRDYSLYWYTIFGMSFWYQMDGDSTDYGTIEISPDNGVSWTNLLTQDTTIQMHWEAPKPSLRGSTSGWQQFHVNIESWAISPSPPSIDTFLLRFTYISDSDSDGDSTAHDGWIIDDFGFQDWWEGITEIQDDNLISISPNPTSDNLRIHKTKSYDKEKVEIMNCTGQVLLNDLHFTGDRVDVSSLPNGVYFLKYTDTINFSIKKFIVQHD